MITIHPLTLLERNVTDQLTASKEIFSIVLELADLVEKIPDDGQKPQLAQIMRRLLDIGEKLSQQADATGKTMLNLVKSVNAGREALATQSEQRSAEAVLTSP